VEIDAFLVLTASLIVGFDNGSIVHQMIHPSHRSIEIDIHKGQVASEMVGSIGRQERARCNEIVDIYIQFDVRLS
jgi:hypothetical protein